MADGLETSLPRVESSPPAVPAGRNVLRALRPKQWAKNVLVVAAPAAAGVLSEGDVLGKVALAFVAFCLISSATYLLNDVRDLESDRLHPTKRHRPIAAGELGVPQALALGVLLLIVGFAVAAVVRLEFLIVAVVYILITASYTMWLKHIAVVDIVAIASGFILRAVAGGVAADVPLSRWFLIVASFGSLFVVSGKRHGEHIDLGEEGAEVRPTLGAYSRNYLQYVWTMTSGVTVAAYCLWAFEMAPGEETVPFYELSIVPFVTFILRYAMLLEQGHGGAPEDVVLGDRTLLVLAAVWAAVFGAGVYVY
ncbi:MAG TPA: decaprenyl-phosphate phosphoribosyltransferase [Thermoleophilaceae bacterium]|nr:decaprenyl-phosphate phosphoribosyltransferase [Thermoleophilaceae bacterium]